MDEAIEANGKVLSEEDEKYLEEPYQAKPVMGFDTSLKIVSRADTGFVELLTSSFSPRWSDRQNCFAFLARRRIYFTWRIVCRLVRSRVAKVVCYCGGM